MLAWDVSNGASIKSDKEFQYQKKIKRKKCVYLMMEFYNTFTVSYNVCGMDSSEMEGANKFF